MPWFHRNELWGCQYCTCGPDVMVLLSECLSFPHWVLIYLSHPLSDIHYTILHLKDCFLSGISGKRGGKIDTLLNMLCMYIGWVYGGEGDSKTIPNLHLATLAIPKVTPNFYYCPPPKEGGLWNWSCVSIHPFVAIPQKQCVGISWYYTSASGIVIRVSAPVIWSFLVWLWSHCILHVRCHRWVTSHRTFCI